MNTEWLEIVEQGFYEQYDKYLRDLPREILTRCYSTTPQSYEEMANELGYQPGSINGEAAELWKLLSYVFREKVNRSNLRGAVDRYVKRIKESNNETSNFEIFISDRSFINSNATEQFQESLQAIGKKTIIGKDWLHLKDEELNRCICFIIILSERSVDESDIVIKEVQRARNLYNTRQDRTLAIIFIHANSCMSLPLNHPLHKELQGISQLEWNSSTELSTLVAEIIRCIETKNEQPIPQDLVSLIQNLRKLKISDNWMLTYIGENQLHKLGNLVHDLKNRKIRSRYAYWGVGPTRMWERACSDPAYHMLENLKQFPLYARNLLQYVEALVLF